LVRFPVFHGFAVRINAPEVWDWIANLGHAFQLKLQRLFHVRGGVFNRFADGAATRYVRAAKLRPSPASEAVAWFASRSSCRLVTKHRPTRTSRGGDAERR